MDVNATLREMRELSATVLDGGALDDADVTRLAELADALDGWLSRGGALPSAWGRFRGDVPSWA